MEPNDLAILAALEDGLPFIPEPFAEIGKTLGITAEEVLDRIKKLQESGVIRRFRARINQRQVGISANALVAWRCNKKSTDKTGAFLASFPSVTHCYERAHPGPVGLLPVYRPSRALAGESYRRSQKNCGCCRSFRLSYPL